MATFDLTGRTALVTGGNGGIGLGIAAALAEAGANVVIAGRNAEKNDAAFERINRRGGQCRSVRCDVDNLDDIDATIAETIDAFGGLQILVNNAGIAAGESPESMTDALWDSVIDTNLRSVFRFSRQAFKSMKEAGFGKIINIGSMYSLFGSAQVPNYSASKGGVVQLTKSLAVAWAPHHIEVNCILPGWITTDMTRPAIDNESFHQQIVQRTPAGRFGEPEECGGAAVFFASSASDFVTGQSLAICGGFSIA
ncbi:MAG: glucose 1-dehydrogenase [Pseudomonadota bacterium]|nr:glucose 1-dehydrogenase [Pseudomonadota bacterium]